MTESSGFADDGRAKQAREANKARASTTWCSTGGFGNETPTALLWCTDYELLNAPDVAHYT